MPLSAPAPAPVPAPVASADASRPAPPAVRQARGAALALLAALLLLCLAWELWLAPTGRGTLALKALPLALCGIGLLRHRLYTYRWLSLLLWLYVTEGLVRATSEHGLSQALAAAEVVLALALFALCVRYIRLRVPKTKGRKAAAP
ncbi:MAG: DUF2069 domain-containing protein [Proteobacteria bacterium]|nr:DUF2069 domain-containing protein [Pseudomonadota bacterium]